MCIEYAKEIFSQWEYALCNMHARICKWQRQQVSFLLGLPSKFFLQNMQNFPFHYQAKKSISSITVLGEHCMQNGGYRHSLLLTFSPTSSAHFFTHFFTLFLCPFSSPSFSPIFCPLLANGCLQVGVQKHPKWLS